MITRVKETEIKLCSSQAWAWPSTDEAPAVEAATQTQPKGARGALMPRNIKLFGFLKRRTTAILKERIGLDTGWPGGMERSMGQKVKARCVLTPHSFPQGQFVSSGGPGTAYTLPGSSNGEQACSNAYNTIQGEKNFHNGTLCFEGGLGI